MKVKVLPSNREFDARPDVPVLTAALRQHFNLPHSCKSGSCGTCRVRIIRGGFAYPRGRPLGISTEEETAGHALICQAHALEDLVIEIHEIRHVTDVEIRELPCRIEWMKPLAPDVMGMWLRLPAIEKFTWQCGQYVDVMLPGERRRSFSLANPPHGARRRRAAAYRGSARPVHLSAGRSAVVADRRRHRLCAAESVDPRGSGNSNLMRTDIVLACARCRGSVRRRVAARARG